MTSPSPIFFESITRLWVGKSPEPRRVQGKENSSLNEIRGRISPAERKSRTCGEFIELLVSCLQVNRMEEIILSGQSNPFGFAIWDSKGIGVRSKNYKDVVSLLCEIIRKEFVIESVAFFVGLPAGIMLSLGLLLIVSETMGLGLSYIPPFATFLMLASMFVVITLLVSVFVSKISVFCWELWLEKETAEWHAVEHKLLWLLERGDALMLEEIRKAPMCHSDCETNKNLRRPTDKKLLEGLVVGLIYRVESKKPRPSPSFFEPIKRFVGWKKP